MRPLFGLLLLLLITTICNGNSKVEEVTRSSGRSRALMVTLGGSEEELMTSLIASLLLSRGYDVTVFAYGSGDVYPKGTEIVYIPVDENDPLSSVSDGKPRYITPSTSDGNLYDVTNPEDPSANQHPPSTYDAIVTSSRHMACQQLLLNTTWRPDQISRAKIFITPLYLHDLCTLTFARQFDLPVVGLVTSRVGAWWAWHWLDITPSLATTPVTSERKMDTMHLWNRAVNIWRFWSYISKLERDWLHPLMTSLPSGTVQPIADLYDHVTSVLVAWDWLTDPDLPMTSYLTSTAGIQWDRSEDLPQVPSHVPKSNGAIFASLKLKELWVGKAAQRAILRALASTPFSVVWRGVWEAQEGVKDGNKTEEGRKGSAMLVFQEDPPMGALLAHPRHRLLISLCGESDAIAAILFGSPTLCIPVTPDQRLTSSKLQELGLGLVVQAGDVTTNQIKDAIRELTSNRSYRSRGRQLAEEYIDQPLSASDRVLHALEKLVRRPWRYKRRHQQRLSLLASSNGDVIAAMLISVTSLFGVAIYVLIVIVRVYIRREKEKKKDE